MFHIDEMGFHFDAQKNGIGGRISLDYTNPDFAEAGKATAKSSEKIIILFGATYSGQPIPCLLVFPNSAKNPRIEV